MPHSTLNSDNSWFNQLFESSPDPAWIIEGNRFVECNEAAILALGYTNREELLNVHPSVLSPTKQPDGEDSFAKAERMMVIARDNGVHRFEWINTKADGSDFVVEVTLSNIELKDRSVIYCVWRDITERKQVEKSLRESEQSHRFSEEQMLMSQQISGTGSWVYNLETNNIWGSAEAFRIFGYPPVAGYFPIEEIESCIPDREHVHQALVDLIGQGRKYDLEYEIYPKDGPPSRTVRSIAILEMEAQGNPLKVLGFVQDITERKQADDALQKSRHNLVEAQNLAHLGSWELDLMHNQLTWSEEMYLIFGMSPEEFGASYETFLNNLHPDDRDRVDQAYLSSLNEGGRYDIEYRIIRRSDGQHRWGHARCEHERDANGKVLRSLGTVQDITERKRAEAELISARQAAESASRAKTRFLAAASHDLRQPLQAISMFHDVLARSGLNEKQKSISHSISKSLNSLGEMLNRFLDISRLEGDKIKPQPVMVKAEDLLWKLDAEFASLAQEKNLRFNLFYSLQGLTLFSDENLLMDLLRNLVSNAVKYTSQGGVLVSIRSRGGRALIQIWDTGIGIASEHQDLIFEENFQVSNPERDRAKGVGLGLAIVRRLSKLLGSEVRCHSRAGKGSVFEISLPLAREPDGHESPIQASAPLAVGEFAHFAGKRIVVIEDDALAAEAIKLSLETHKMQVTLFGTAEDALGSTEVAGADYYISDYRLPGMDGLQLLDAIQNASAIPINALLLTGDTSPERIALAQSSRWTVLFKPIDLPKLLSAMEP
jgi:PAS domain S-box-containing protein